MPEQFDRTPSPAAEEEEIFDYGDRTIMRLETQHFDIDDFGTVVSLPREPADTREIPIPEPIAPESEDEDPIARLERKLDLAIRHIAALQQRLESMDATLVRILTR